MPSYAELFPCDTSLFYVMHCSNTFALEMNSDLTKKNIWAFQWKMSFNPDSKKQAHEVIFSRISKVISHHPLVFNSNNNDDDNNNKNNNNNNNNIFLKLHDIYLSIDTE